MRLLSELRRRKVFGVAAAYAIAAWGVIEVSSTVLQMASAPAWIARVVLAVVALGFPVALVLAWFFDLSPSGIVRTPDADSTELNAAAQTSRTAHLLFAAGLVAVAAVATAFAVWIRPETRRDLQFTQLTNFSDAATAPALSPDGKTVAFIKGIGLFGNSASPGDLYIKQLPDGDAVQLTNSSAGKATPSFTPDGQHVAFTFADAKFRWSTHIVSTNGGPGTELLPNASGLSWLDSTHVLFAETRQAAHMGIRRATITRADEHDVYWPAKEQAMAHRAAASPDRKWILIVEMEAGIWLPCRLVPFDGSSTGRRVGPANGQCSYAAWSPDGRWMYFSSTAGSGFHIWRQRFPNGQPEQLTNGPTEEEGLAVAPDGKSLITSAGVRQNSIWLIDSAGDRQISVEQYAFMPKAARDGKRVFFLSRVAGKRDYNTGKLIAHDLGDNTRQEFFPGSTMVHYDLSADDSLVLFTTGHDDVAVQGVWVAPLDRSAPPRRVLEGFVERTFFDPDRNIYFLETEGTRRFVHRLRAPEYKVNERVYDGVLHFIFAASPDGEWLIAAAPGPKGEGLQEIAVSTRRLPARTICSYCGGGVGPGRQAPPPLSWTRDGRTLLVSIQYVSPQFWMGPAFTVAIPVRAGASLPDLPVTGIASEKNYTQQPGARIVHNKHVLPGATGQQLFYYQPTTLRNLYRLQLPN